MGGRAVVACAVLIVPVVLALATFELKAVYAVVGLAAAVWMVWYLRTDLRQALRAAVERRSATRPAPADQPGRRGAAPTAPSTARRPRWAGVVGLLVVAAAGGGVAWVAALLGTKGLVATAGGVALVSLLLFVKDRSVFFTFAAVCSLAFLLHKSIGPQDLTHGGGAISVYVTSFDIVLLLLYGLWIREGTFVADVKAAVQRPVVWLPLVALLFLLPSMLVASDVRLAAGELVRMVWMYLLYAYVAIRVRTVRHLWAVLGGLGVVAAVELVVVLLQWRTGGVLGLEFLGIPESLIPRTTDAGEIGRPSGTLLHPAFMAATMGLIAMPALALAIELRHRLIRIAAFGVALAGLACMWISQARASFVAVLAAGAVVVLVGLVRRRITWRTVGAFALVAALAGLALWDRIAEKLADNFATGHYLTEVQSRLQLNEVALRMIDDRPLVGVGLNNFESVLGRYEANPVIFPGFPVHNLYLLWIAEVGVLGFVGVAGLGIALYQMAIRLGRNDDRLLAGIGIGVAGAMGFIMVEELLSYTMRGDVPLALYWLLAGLAAAGTTMAGRSGPERAARARRAMPTRPTQLPGAATKGPLVGVRTRLGLVRPRSLLALAVTLGLLGTAAPLLPDIIAAGPTAAAAKAPALTFSATDRATKLDHVYTLNADGTGLRQVTPNDGRFYNWGRFAFGNTKIVFTVKESRVKDAPEDIGLMNLDGSDLQTIAEFDYQVLQPVVDPTGRWLHYTAKAPFFPVVAQFRLDLVTGESTNISAVERPDRGFDSDPFLTADGDRLLFVNNNPSRGAEIKEMNPDGTDRADLTTDKYFNTDPTITRDGRTVAISSYRGPGAPSDQRPEDWFVTVQSRPGGAKTETVLNEGVNCVLRTRAEPCTPKEMSGFQPRFTPDQREVSYVGALDNTRTCICAMQLDGSDPRVVYESTRLAINWQDWAQPPGYATSTRHINTEPRKSRVLLVIADKDKRTSLVIASPDLTRRETLTVPDGVEPIDARWAPDGRSILFTGKVAVGPRQGPHPAPPPGSTRREHMTLDDLEAMSLHQRAELTEDVAAEQQVFLRTPEGETRQLTDPWIEDWRDGLREGDARANSQPRMSADGRFLVVTNTSTLTGESFLLRIDLRSGEVVNLTNGSAGAVPTDDADAVWIPGRDRLAFSWSEGDLRGVYAMDAGTGENVRAITRDRVSTAAPAWSADGSVLVYTRATPSGEQAVMRSRVRADGTAVDARTVSRSLPSAWAPVLTPEGDRIAFLAIGRSSIGVYTSDLRATKAPRPLQPDIVANVLSVDWK